MTEPTMKERLKDESFWLRLPFMLLFFFAWRLAELILLGVIFVQVVFRLFKGEPQEQLLKFASQLTCFSYQTFRYLTFNSETKPFPFSAWPKAVAVDDNPYVPSDHTETKENSAE
ncbi:DUF4389 domain-containing protein [Marinospirillum insulare]|uniref:Lipase n=1 Tax=Marinospirillum insulare TaxID=217169 RepID=A0ABQ5ZWA9_9GAMM|nr:DUF4389 domain-containing protein [Marinospirillum insulare]GLR64449.1 hypothetical protein GCM10007878_18870 [Marinospirillum insulare]